MIINLNLKEKSYDINLLRGGINQAKKLFNLERKVLIVTDSGVPKEYALTVASQSKNPYVITLPQGETTKCAKEYLSLLQVLTEKGFTRTDCVVAVGGGVVGDLAGFVASTYMRGIDFYNIPTTVLSQVDSSIGGKVAIDFCGYKNIVGAFYQPKGVIIDPELLKTLPQRQISNGLAESLKMALTSDAELFRIFEQEDIETNMDTIIERSLKIKKAVVETDEKEAGLRKILNFGHTLAHAIESEYQMEQFYHGECVALGMIPMCEDSIKPRLIAVLEKLNLPTKAEINRDKIANAILHDKKMSGDKISVIYVEKIGEWQMKTLTPNQLLKELEGVF